jgi:hypothetical protein
MTPLKRRRVFLNFTQKTGKKGNSSIDLVGLLGLFWYRPKDCLQSRDVFWQQHTLKVVLFVDRLIVIWQSNRNNSHGVLRMKKTLVTLLSLAMMSSSVLAGGSAATITDFSGKVLVNHGKGFAPASGVVSLNAGDKVMVGENSFAVVSFAECAVSLSTPTVLAIAEKAPCATASGDVAVISPVADMDVAAAPIIPVPLIVLGVVGIAGVGLVASGVLDDKNDPASGF